MGGGSLLPFVFSFERRIQCRVDIKVFSTWTEWKEQFHWLCFFSLTKEQAFLPFFGQLCVDLFGAFVWQWQVQFIILFYDCNSTQPKAIYYIVLWLWFNSTKKASNELWLLKCKHILLLMNFVFKVQLLEFTWWMCRYKNLSNKPSSISDYTDKISSSYSNNIDFYMPIIKFISKIGKSNDLEKQEV